MTKPRLKWDGHSWLVYSEVDMDRVLYYAALEWSRKMRLKAAAPLWLASL